MTDAGMVLNCIFLFGLSLQGYSFYLEANCIFLHCFCDFFASRFGEDGCSGWLILQTCTIFFNLQLLPRYVSLYQHLNDSHFAM